MNDLMKLFIEGDVVVNLRTNKVYLEFLKLCEEQGLRWLNGDMPTENAYWDDERFCLHCRNKKNISWARVIDYERNDYRIIEFN